MRASRWNAADARRALAEWEKSGRGLAEFARSRGWNPQRLSWWRKRLASSEIDAAQTLIPAIVSSANATAQDARVVVRFPRGVIVEAAEIDALPASWVVSLLRELERA